MKNKITLKNMLIVGIIFLFILSSVIPTVIGHNDRKNITLFDESINDDFIFNNFDVYRYPEHIAREKYPEQFYQTDNNFNNKNEECSNGIYQKTIYENVIQQNQQTSGLMDSAWPMHCHDIRHTGRSPYDTTNTWGEIWHVKDETYYMRVSPVISNDGTIYCGALNIYAINPNGSIKWKRDLSGYIWSAPAIDENGVIYFGTMYGAPSSFYAINSDGTLKWKYSVGLSVQSSPAIGDDGTIYFGSDNKNVYAFYRNGTLKWNYFTGHLVMSSPAIGLDGTIYYGVLGPGYGEGFVYAFNPNGTLKWTFNTGTWVHGSAAIGDDGTVYIGADDGSFYALYPDNGTMKWRIGLEGAIWSTPVINENSTIYVGDYNGYFYAIRPNGTIKWKFNTGGSFWFGSSAAISAEGTLYFGSSNNFFSIYPDGTEKWRFHKGHFSSSPAIGENGILYITSWVYENRGTKGYLYAFGIVELKANANGPYYGLINEPVQFNGKGMGGYSPFSYYWDFGDTHTSDEQNPTHTYTVDGNYTVTLIVTDNTSNTSVDHTWAWIQESNVPPDKPTIEGPTRGKSMELHYYTFSTTDPDGTPIWYYIDWDDPYSGNPGWIGPSPSSGNIVLSHWWGRGTYIIRCKAKDPYGAEGPWGELKVIMPRNKAVVDSLFFKLLDYFPLLERLLLNLRLIN